MAYFPFSEGTGFVGQSQDSVGDYGGSVSGAEWVQDNVWKSSPTDAGNVLHCTKEELDFVLLEDIPYGTAQGFTIRLVIVIPLGEKLWQYLNFRFCFPQLLVPESRFPWFSV